MADMQTASVKRINVNRSENQLLLERYNHAEWLVELLGKEHDLIKVSGQFEKEISRDDLWAALLFNRIELVDPELTISVGTANLIEFVAQKIQEAYDRGSREKEVTMLEAMSRQEREREKESTTSPSSNGKNAAEILVERKPLTDAETKVFYALRKYNNRYKKNPPTYAKLAHLAGIKTTSCASFVQTLMKKGHLKREGEGVGLENIVFTY